MVNITEICRQKSKHINRNEETNNFIKNEKNDLPKFLIYGEIAPIGYTEEQDSLITKKFGFGIERVAGCEVTQELIDSIKIINEKNDLVMQSKYGKNWKEKFETETKLKLAIPNI